MIFFFTGFISRDEKFLTFLTHVVRTSFNFSFISLSVFLLIRIVDVDSRVNLAILD